MRLSEIALHLAEIDGRDADELHIRLRNPLFKALLEGTPGRSKNSPADYSHDELIRARLLVAAADWGLTTAQLGKMNDALNRLPAPGAHHAPEAKTEAGYIYPDGLHCIIRGARAGSDWVISLRLTRRGGVVNLRAIVSLRENLGADEEAAHMMDLMEGRTYQGTLILPAADLVKPLLDADA